MSLALTISGRGLYSRLRLLAAAFTLLLASAAPVRAQQPVASRVTLVTRLADATASDAGPTPLSQRLSLTLTLAPSATQAAALDQVLTDLTTPSSPTYHRWLTPHQFAAAYGASADQIATTTSWLTSQGLSVDAVSPSGLRLTVSGFAAQIESTFAVTLRNYQISGGLYFAPSNLPSLPGGIAPLITAIDGLDNLPSDLGTLTTGSSAHVRTTINTQPGALTLASLGALVDANATPVLALDASAATGTQSPAQIAGLAALFRQAAAQGITTVVYGATSNSAFPSGFPEVTSIAAPSAAPDISAPFAQRPPWQNAAGLPADSFRHAPDLAASSLEAITQALSSIVIETSSPRLGNINPTLYALAPTPGLYTQPDSPVAGTWEAATGLGLVDLAQLVRAYPRGSGTSNFQLTSSSSSPIHGQGFTLTATAMSTNGGGVPTGSVTFSATQSNFTSATIALNGAGVAVTPTLLLPGGTYNVTASYSGDANYAPATATLALTVQPEAAGFTLAAPTSVALGASITAVATLTSISGVGTPAASITVTPSGITGATAQTIAVAPVSGTPGTANASFVFTTVQAGSVSLQAACAPSDSSYTCYTPQTATITVPQATPTVSLAISPTSPSAGSPVTFTAKVAGVTGIAPTGSVQFYDGNTSLGFGGAPTATYSGTLAPGASHTLSAVYQGDSNYLKATSSTLTVSVGTSSTTTNVIPSATTASFGQAITLNITVSTPTVVNGTQPTGTLTFTGAGSVTSAPVSGGSANVTLNNLTVGTWTITTAYSGDTNYSASTGNTVVITVTQATASLQTSISSTGFTTGSTSTLTATINLPGNGQLPTGSTFIASIQGISGASYTGTFAVNPGGNTGTGQVTIPAPIAGTYTLQVTCGTNANFTCIPSSLTISSTATSGSTGGSGLTGGSGALIVTLSSNSALPGASGTVTAAVTAPTGTVPTGTITVVISSMGATVSTFTGALPGTGTSNMASIIIPVTFPTTQGLYSITTSCTNTNFTCTPVTLGLSISNTPGLVPTQTVLTTAPSTSTSGSTTLTATITPLLAGTSTLTGTVTFFDGTMQLGKSTVSGSTPTATLTVALSATATHSLTAVYSGDTNYATSTSAVVNSLNSGVASATVTLSSSVGMVTAGTSVVLTATVTGSVTNSAGTVIGPTGTVSFYIDGATPALIGTATIGTSSKGIALAVFSTSNLPSGPLKIYASYGGDANFSAAISADITLGISDYALAFVPTTLTVSQGQTGTATGVVTFIGAFPGTITLSCTPPANSNVTCGFNPTTLTTAGTTTLTVTTTASAHAVREGGSNFKVAGALSFAALLCWFLPGRHRRRIPAMLLALLALSLGMNLGCAANDFVSTFSNSASTPLGTMLLQINTTGTSGTSSVRHGYSYQVTVQ